MADNCKGTGFKPQGLAGKVKEVVTNPSGFAGGVAKSAMREALGGIGNVFSTKPNAKYASGARTIIKINNVPVAFAFGVSWNIETAQTEIRTVDDYLPYEFAPKMVSVSGSVTGWHIPGVSPTSELQQPNVFSFLFHQYVSIEVRDSATDSLLFETKKAVFTSRQESINIDALATMSLKFKAIGWKDEKVPGFPQGYKH